jgi:hypothetical protein
MRARIATAWEVLWLPNHASSPLPIRSTHFHRRILYAHTIDEQSQLLNEQL